MTAPTRKWIGVQFGGGQERSMFGGPCTLNRQGGLFCWFSLVKLEANRQQVEVLGLTVDL